MTVVNMDYTATWNRPTGGTGKIGGMALYVRSGGGAWEKLGVYTGYTHVVKDLRVGVVYEIAAAVVDGDGNVAPVKYWDIQKVTPIGNAEKPPTATNLTAVQDEEFIDIEWDDCSEKSEDFDHYEVRVGSSWALGQLVLKPKTNECRTKWETSGATTYRVAVFDKYGKRGTEDTFALTIQALQGFVAGATMDEDGGGFTGTKTDSEVSGSDLIMTAWGDPANTATGMANLATWLPMGKHEAIYETAKQDLGSTRNVRIELDMTVEVVADTDFSARMAGDCNLPPQLNEDADVDTDWVDETSRIQVGDCIAGADERALEVVREIKLDSGSWQRFIPGFYHCQYITFRIRLRSWNRFRRIKISKLQINEKKRNLKDEGIEAVVASAGPTFITFAETFIDSPKVTCNSDTAGFFVRVVSTTTTTATVRVYDNDGTEVFTGNVYWIAAGT